jgi:hypothetical protein
LQFIIAKLNFFNICTFSERKLIHFNIMESSRDSGFKMRQNGIWVKDSLSAEHALQRNFCFMPKPQTHQMKEPAYANNHISPRVAAIAASRSPFYSLPFSKLNLSFLNGILSNNWNNS